MRSWNISSENRILLSNEKKHIAIFQSDLRVGGIQRSLINLLKFLSEEENISVDVFLFDDRNAFFEIPSSERIRVFYLKRLFYLNRLLPFSLNRLLFQKRMEKQIREAVSEDVSYDLVLDFNSYWTECALGCKAVSGKQRYCFVHNDVEIKWREEWKYRLLHFFFRKKYSLYDGMIMVSGALAKPFYRMNGVYAPKRYYVIPNVIDFSLIREMAREDGCEFSVDSKKMNFVSVGRLCHQKGFDLLLHEILDLKDRCGESFSRYHFYFVGDGPDRDALEKQAGDLGIADAITFTGNLNNPFCLMRQCDGFVMDARYEGQPLAYWEAKALGLTVIIPEHLQKYTEGIEGCEDLPMAMADLPKRECIPDTGALEVYHRRIVLAYRELLTGDLQNE